MSESKVRKPCPLCSSNKFIGLVNDNVGRYGIACFACDLYFGVALETGDDLVFNKWSATFPTADAAMKAWDEKNEQIKDDNDMSLQTVIEKLGTVLEETEHYETTKQNKNIKIKTTIYYFNGLIYKRTEPGKFKDLPFSREEVRNMFAQNSSVRIDEQLELSEQGTNRLKLELSNENKPVQKRIDEICSACGMSMRRFAKVFNIPLRSLENWKVGATTPPPYILSLLEEVVKHISE